MAVSDYGIGTNWSNEQQYLNGLVAQGGGNATWANQQLADLNAAKQMYGVSGSYGMYPSMLGDYQNMLDAVTGISDKTSARSFEYARQYQDWSASQAQIANNFNAAEAQKNRDWQEYMSNTAHQREMADLKAAGLNPVLAAMNGNGASVTSGATASANMPSGEAGRSDTSANTALVSILGSMLNAQTQLTNQLVSARTQESVAEKYTAMSYLTAQLAAGASMYGSDMQYRMRQDFPETLMGVLNSAFTNGDTSLGEWIYNMFGAISDMFSGNPREGSFANMFKDLYNKADQVLNNGSPGNNYGDARNYGWTSGKSIRGREKQ